MSTAPWLRLNAAIYTDPRLRACRPYGVPVWVALLTLSKLHGWDGECPLDLVEPAALCDYMGFPESEARPIGDTVDALIAKGLLRKSAASLEIVGWRDFQPDPTGAARQRAFRSRSVTPVTPVTVTTVSHGDVRDVRDIQKEEAPPTPPSPEPKAEPEADEPRPGPVLSGGLAQRLSLDGVNLRDRPGFTPEWEKLVRLAAEDGRYEAVLEWLKNKANRLCKPVDLQNFLAPRGKFGGPPAETPAEFKARKAARREAWIAEKVTELRGFSVPNRLPWLEEIEQAKGPEVRAEIERRLGAA